MQNLDYPKGSLQSTIISYVLSKGFLSINLKVQNNINDSLKHNFGSLGFKENNGNFYTVNNNHNALFCGFE